MQEHSPLEEKDFIHEEYRKNPWPFWGWLGVVITFTLLFYGSSLFYYSTLAEQYAHHPFLQVTNREMSLFLWQNPQHMRIHVKKKNGYLPAFQYAERIGLDPEYADDYVVAPPELLFLYHTWHRLLGKVYIPRSISAKEFSTFLSAAPEWLPRFWQKAPIRYIALLDQLQARENENLNLVSFEELPLDVRNAFVGWKNYYFEGDQINALNSTYQDVAHFLAEYPHYGRSYWCNIVGDSYLKTLQDKKNSEFMPADELSPLLRVALFNKAASRK